MPALEVYLEIDKMFKWCEAFDRYNSIKVKLFHPEWCVPSRRGVHVTRLHSITIKYKPSGLSEIIHFSS